ncbi:MULTISPECIES: organic hydroperoxide resistance protein [Roseivirga]|jgi:Ohr subfamily peroxiredoxin|uniref:Organic hydroperoxide resistance protein n=1 Tax=Roseivirga spongicola TaxID=333140 RepID=A0A150X694_9BACT|nr:MULTISPECIES: organic hydroperoxide resistance protein [Roseivirga]PWL28066.1 MAG: organic hydroperoxide resistance protein [Roseivirga sp. XM-24bin3]KYG74230.1 organic hydroperoxide resistance protein [Roseivirga spongicola]MBO6495220.1 organic hydroperoxide resistance protein [Roseivirga sp.]MBO6660568.1 organic hydroperoxide resistance protein [Roseivirga sp.]MBO6762791.1 organic hydroperoxide resistance protein [Roseivirga sp.]|tara:strand:- start:115 stop:537 length:423 start_codon:yes stop_codon:yes gene_type:complete
MKTMYTIGATATGGRNGHVKSENGILDLEVRHPKALGGANDDYANPEMLFAAGYAACFDSALNLVIQKSNAKTGTTSVKANVSIGQTDNGGFGLAVTLDINIPEVDMEEAKSLAEKAHQVCPYSNATRGNIEVELNVTND